MFTIGEWGILVGSLLVLMIWTYMWKATKVFHYGSAVCVGATMGHFFVIAIQTLYEIAYLRVLKEAWVIIPIILGFMLFARFRRGFGWLSTTSISVIVGVSLGLLVAGGIYTQILGQITLVMGLPFVGADVFTLFNSLVTFFGCFAVIAYFLFQRSLADLAPIRALTRLGRILMLGAGGVGFATGYAFRITMMLNALQPYNATWPGQIAFPIVAVMVIAYILWERSQK